MPFTERAGHRIHFQTWGAPSAPPLLLVMGLGISLRGWDELPDRLAERFHVIAFDNCGTGRSGRRRGLFRMQVLADDAVAVLDALGIGEACVFGISMGGMIAQEIALRHPDRVRALALGATYASYVLSRKPSMFAAAELLMLVAAGERARQNVVGRLLTTKQFVQSSPQVIASWFSRTDHARGLPALAQLLAILAHHTSNRLAGIRCPTVVLTGDSDRLVPPENALALARLIPNAKLHVLKDAGHVFPLERGAETVAILNEHFLMAWQQGSSQGSDASNA